MDTINEALSKLKIDEKLLGINKNYTIDTYYKRDLLMNINGCDHIINSLKKLRYYNIDQNFECNKFIIESLMLNSKYLEKTKTIDKLADEFKETAEYKNFLHNINLRIGRALVLSSFINSNDILNFYNALTLEELNYLGY
jgi:hypothetical protein